MALSAGKAAEGIDAEVSAARETPPSSSRLSMPFRERLILSECGAAIGGFALGATQGGLVAGLRFRAENAHRLPETTTGWYFYHRSKNYNAMFGGIKEGLRLGGRTCVWVSAYVLAEEAVDQLRGGSRDFVSSVVASLALAGFVSAWNRFPAPTAARTAKTGIRFGLAYGLAQDALATLRGRRPYYLRILTGSQS